MGGLTIENNFFILKIEKRNKIIVFDFQKVGAEAQKSGGAAALPAPPPPRSLIVSTFFLFVAKQVARFCGTFYLSLNFIFFSFEVRYVHRSPHRPQLKVCFLFLAEQMFRETAPLFC